MRIYPRIKIQIIAMTILLSLAAATTTYVNTKSYNGKVELPCPVAFYNGLPMDEGFGVGAQVITHCF